MKSYDFLLAEAISFSVHGSPGLESFDGDTVDSLTAEHFV